MPQNVLSRWAATYSSPTFFTYACSGLLLLLLSVSVYLAKHHGVVGLIADDAIYLLMANYFSLYTPTDMQNSAYVW